MTDYAKDKRLISIQAAAELEGVAVNTVARWGRKGWITIYRTEKHKGERWIDPEEQKEAAARYRELS